jgi:hypothetical protein
MTITPVETSGDAPGWLQRHSAELAHEGRAIIVRGGEVWLGDQRTMQENIDAWSLDVASGRWTRLSALDWQHWTMLRVDRKPNRLYDVRQELWHREHGWEGLPSYWKHEDDPDFEALAALYRLDESIPPPEQGLEHNVYRVTIDGITVRFTEDRWSVQAWSRGDFPMYDSRILSAIRWRPCSDSTPASGRLSRGERSTAVTPAVRARRFLSLMIFKGAS